MAYNIGNQPTALTTAASGDKLKVHDVSADAEKYITAANLTGSGVAVENFDITTGTPDYAITETAGRDVALFITETNDADSVITLPASGLRDGQKVTITFNAALNPGTATFAKGGAGAISATHAAVVTQYQTFLFIYDETNDIFYGSTLAITS